MIFIQSAVNGCHLLKFVNLAAPLHIRTNSIFYIQLALQARALLEDIKVWLSSISLYRLYALEATFLAPCRGYDKKPISHIYAL